VNRASVAATLVVGLLVGACDTAVPSGGTQPPDAPSSTASAGATSQPVGTFGPPSSPTSTPDDTTGVVLDPTVLEILPESIDGIPVEEDADEAANLFGTLDLGELAEAADAAVAVDTGSGNLVVAWVVRLRDGAMNAEAFRQWRDSYDEGACNAAGGIVGNAEAEIGGRNTYITTCVAALRTYHVWLEEQNMLVSASSIGEDRFGEKLVAGLRLPE
jgi:hypothetical protein